MEEQGSYRELAPKEGAGLCMLTASFPGSSRLSREQASECCTGTVPAAGKETSGVGKKSSTITFSAFHHSSFVNSLKSYSSEYEVPQIPYMSYVGPGF